MTINVKAMKPSHKAIYTKAAALVTQLDQPWYASDLERLVHYLRKCKHGSPWGIVIRDILSVPVPDANVLNSMIDNLSKQAVDDFVTMTEIVGSDATILLLRYYDKKTQHNEQTAGSEISPAKGDHTNGQNTRP